MTIQYKPMRKWLLFMGVLVLGACGVTVGQVQQRSCAGGEVEFDIFSGRPNPILPLSDSECTTIVTTLQSLTETTPFEASDQLGYRGAYVSLNEVDHNQKIIHSEIYVLGDRLRVTQDDVTRFLADPDHRMEAVLLEQAAQSLEPDTVSLLKEVMN